ncbi:epoxide hydrolase family protein [Kribbella sp. NPDC051587]|uniref:epoxide hydrolase family protein n=1 Tax=Kribbella sp. NPDC051587 TaxID=3364119 RepID=UPI0037AB2DF7
MTPFEVQVPQEAIDDLKARLRLTRWPDRELVDDWTQGVPLQAAQELVDYWLNDYDWRRFEARLNSYPQFKTTIDGVGIHYLHVRSSYQDALPVVLTHGWPGSVIEFLDVIDRLTEPERFGGRAEDAFHVVIPAIPGFGFSDKPRDTGWNPVRIARAWTVLMQRLGYEKWVAQGGDLGAAITTALAAQAPAGLLAAHVNLPLVVPADLPAEPTVAEARALEGLHEFVNDATGYADQMNTRPQTIGYALNDSPVALAMWMYEKFEAWSGSEGLTRDQILDDISLYWFTGTGTSSARLYWESIGATIQGPEFFASPGLIELPMAASIFPYENYLPPREWAERTWKQIFHWNELDRGGHFAAFEQPDLFATELWTAFRQFR